MSSITGQSDNHKGHERSRRNPNDRGAERAAKFDSWGCDLDVSVGVAPQEGDAGEPVFCVDRMADAGRLFGCQDENGCGEFGAGDFAADGARGDLDLRVVANALALSGFTVRHEVELVVVFGKPDGRVYSATTFAESGEADVTLAVDFSGDDSHADIVKCCVRIVAGECTRILSSTSVACC